jgi:hypothetical protein
MLRDVFGGRRRRERGADAPALRQAKLANEVRDAEEAVRTTRSSLDRL